MILGKQSAAESTDFNRNSFLVSWFPRWMYYACVPKACLEQLNQTLKAQELDDKPNMKTPAECFLYSITEESL